MCPYSFIDLLDLHEIMAASGFLNPLRQGRNSRESPSFSSKKRTSSLGEGLPSRRLFSRPGVSVRLESVGRVLCVEDGLDTIAILEATLRGHDLRFARSLREAEEALTSGEFFHLILLDIELPDGSGIDLMSRHASEFEDVSVILLTGKTDLSWKAAAFALGAEDFIEKPFDPQELRLRVEAKLRREQRRRTLHLGSLTCSLDEQRLFKGPQREPVDLTTLEFRIFTLLARTPQKIFARGESLDRVWGSHVAVTERAVDVHVSHLRNKLEDTGVTIEAVVGAGYRLSAPNLSRGRDLSL